MANLILSNIKSVLHKYEAGGVRWHVTLLLISSVTSNVTHLYSKINDWVKGTSIYCQTSAKRSKAKMHIVELKNDGKG